MKEMNGHTLVELVACLLICGILVSISIPLFSALTLRTNTSQQVNQLVGLLHYARSLAVFQKQNIDICSGHRKCGKSEVWSSELLVFNDTNGNGQRDGNEEPIRHDRIPSGYSWHWSNFRHKNYLQYEKDGTTRALNGTFTLCLEGRPLRQVVISLAGRVKAQSPKLTAHCT